MSFPPPGALEAVEMGCICPGPQNPSPLLQGEPARFIDAVLAVNPHIFDDSYWFDFTCPLHGKGDWREQSKE